MSDLYEVANMTEENQAIQRPGQWSGPRETIEAIRQEYAGIFSTVFNCSNPSILATSGRSEAIALLGHMANRSINQEFGSQLDNIAMKMLTDAIPDLIISLVPRHGGSQGLRFMDEGTILLTRETPVRVKSKSRGIDFLVLTMRNNAVDGSYVTYAYMITSHIDDNRDIIAFLMEVRSIVSLARRQIRVINVIGGENIPLPVTSWSTWDDVFLPPDTLTRIKDDLELFLTSKQTFRDAGIPWKRGFLLTGSPGNGKSLCCRTIATSMPFSAYMFDFSNPQMNNANLTKAFKEAVEDSPSVFFLEDIDRVWDDGNKGNGTAITMDHLLNCIDGIGVNDGLIIVATANNPERLDPAIRSRPGRFDQVIEIKAPDAELRRRYLVHLFRNVDYDVGGIDYAVEKCDGMSMAFLKEVFVVSATKSIGKGMARVPEQAIRDAVDQITLQYNGVSAGRRAGF